MHSVSCALIRNVDSPRGQWVNSSLLAHTSTAIQDNLCTKSIWSIFEIIVGFILFGSKVDYWLKEIYHHVRAIYRCNKIHQAYIVFFALSSKHLTCHGVKLVENANKIVKPHPNVQSFSIPDRIMVVKWIRVCGYKRACMDISKLKPATPGPRFNIKMTSYQYRKSHCGDKTILRPSYLHNGISYTGKMTSLYWIGALDSP